MPNDLFSPPVAGLVSLAVEAGHAIMSIYEGEAPARWKDDMTPVTEADLKAENIILSGLARLCPGVPVLSEESAALGFLPPLGERFFLVDPLDGTKEFLSRNGEFTVNIALIEHSVPTFGVVFAPAVPRLFWAEKSTGAFETELAGGRWERDSIHRLLKAPPMPDGRLRALASRSHRDALTEAWLKSHDIANLVCAGSSLKFCIIATGEADVYPRFGRTMEWDTAAGHAILRIAGGKVVTEADGELSYGKSATGFANPAFIASGS